MKRSASSRAGNGREIPAGFLAREGRRKTGRAGRAVSVSVAAILLVLGMLLAADYLVNANEVHRGVRAGDVSLGGMSREEARAALRERSSGELRSIRLRGDRDAEIPAREIGLDLDAAATAERAYSVGREGGILARAGDRLGAALGLERVEPAVAYRAGALGAELEGVAAELDREPRGAAVSVEGGRTITAGQGYLVDVEATQRGVERAIAELRGEAELAGEPAGRLTGAEAGRARSAVEEPLVLAYGGQRWTLSTDRVAEAVSVSGGADGAEAGLRRGALESALSDALGGIERAPVEARLFSGERGSVEVEAARDGREVEMERLLDEIEAGVFEGRHRYDVPVSAVEPELTTEEAEAARPNTLIGEFETGYEVYDEPGRIENLKTASESVDGTILAPGETFSFNEAAAPIERYEPSEVIVDGRLQTALGGGLCQVSSTLYMAANYAGLEVVERAPHYAELPYIRPGFDATVWFGSLDLKFRNDTGEYLLLEERVDEQTGEVVARIYGQPDDREVEMDSRKVSDNGDTTSWRSTRTIVEDGRVTEDGLQSADTYRALEPDSPAPAGLGG